MGLKELGNPVDVRNPCEMPRAMLVDANDMSKNWYGGLDELGLPRVVGTRPKKLVDEVQREKREQDIPALLAARNAII